MLIEGWKRNGTCFREPDRAQHPGCRYGSLGWIVSESSLEDIFAVFGAYIEDSYLNLYASLDRSNDLLDRLFVLSFIPLSTAICSTTGSV